MMFSTNKEGYNHRLIQIKMRVSEFNRDGSRSPGKDKENFHGCSSLDLESVRAMVLRNEQTLN